MKRSIWSATVTVVLWFVFGFGNRVEWRANEKRRKPLVGLTVIPVGCIASVPTGHTGILTAFGKAEDVTSEAGPHVKLPEYYAGGAESVMLVLGLLDTESK